MIEKRYIDAIQLQKDIIETGIYPVCVRRKIERAQSVNITSITDISDKKLLFNRCECGNYYVKANDGKYLYHLDAKYSEDGKSHWMCHNGDGVVETESECCGSYDIHKTYYTLKESKFSGVVVGYTDLTISAFIYVDSDDHDVYFCRRYKAEEASINYD